MPSLCLFLVFVTGFLSLQLVLADDDDDDGDCKFVKTLAAKSDFKQLTLSLSQVQYSRYNCVYYNIVADSSSEVIEVQVPDIHPLLNATCSTGFLKLLDDDSEWQSDLTNWSANSKVTSKGQKLKIYFKPAFCILNLTLGYRSVRKLAGDSSEESEERHKKGYLYDYNGEDEEAKHERHSNKTGSIVGAVIGGLFALLLVVLVVVFVKKYVKRSRTQQASAADDSLTVHFWSKPSGYAPATEVVTSSSGALATSDVQYGEQSKKARFAGVTDECGSNYNKEASSAFSFVSPPAPPPYPGHSRTELLRDELPPPYAYAANEK